MLRKNTRIGLIALQPNYEEIVTDVTFIRVLITR